MNEITRKCLQLPIEQRRKLARILNESIFEERTDDGSRFAVLYKAASEVCGKGILTGSRDFNLVLGRRMIAYQMRQEGFKLQDIGKHLVKHHASIIHLIKGMQDVHDYPDVFKLEMAYWEEFKKKVKEYETDRATN
jgi:hypothetical protein